ncbi:MAG: hypothetical protein II180_11400, partial [Proteobacteria bacterium]|nr:hypothetical protein [Pseudomonadota bacterium]
MQKVAISVCIIAGCMLSACTTDCECDRPCNENCGDGVCGSGETSSTCPADCSTNCGNGRIETGEQCDLNNFGAATCQNLMGACWSGQ